MTSSENDSPIERLRYYPVRNPDDFLGARSVVEEIIDRIDDYTQKPISSEIRGEILSDFMGGYAYFMELARQAGELAESGSPSAALKLLGGEEEARFMLGDETVDQLLEKIGKEVQNDVDLL